MSEVERQIWIVDDVPSNRRLLEKILRRAGYECALFKSAESLLEALQTERPALILMDVMMPGITGLDALMSMRQRELRGDVPVVLVTSMTDPSIRERAFHWGANDFVSKPVNKNELLMRVQRLYDEQTRNAARLMSSVDESMRILLVGCQAGGALAGLTTYVDVELEACPPSLDPRSLEDAHIVVVDVTNAGGVATVRDVSDQADLPLVAIVRSEVEALGALDAGACLCVMPNQNPSVVAGQIRALGERVFRYNALRRELARVRRRVLVDPDTGLLAPESFHDALSFEQDRSRRFRHDTSLILLRLGSDLNRQAGGSRAAVLKALGAAVKQATRSVDIAGRLARLELGIVLPETSDVGALEVMRRLKSEVNRAAVHVGGGKEVAVGIEIGATTSRSGGADAQSMIDTARTALESIPG